MNATVITYRNGEIVTEEAEAHFERIEHEKETARILSLHVANLMAMSGRGMRNEYLATVDRKEGEEAAQRLKAAFGAAWDARKAAE